jgi:hypothetical protein
MSRRVPAINIMEILFSVIFGLIASFLAASFFSEWIAGYFEAIFGIFCIASAGVIIANVLLKRSAMQEMEKGKTTTLATVIDRHVSETHCDYGGVCYTYYIVFRFIAVEKEWTLKAGVCRKLYDKANQGKLSMIYADSDPRCVLFEGEY